MAVVNEIRAKHILTKTRLPGADYVINHYSGCAHACVYCYARFVCRWRKGKEKWGDFVDVKTNAPELVKKESEGKTGTVFLSSVSDPYQPIEKKYKLTRRVLQNLNRDMKLSVLTKSDLITRDIDLFREFKQHDLGLTITTMDESVRRVFEPGSSSSERRLAALRKLKQAGLTTYVFIGPILPYLTDMDEIMEKTAAYADKFMFEDLNLAAAKTEIMKTIKENFPELHDKYKNLSKEFWLKKQDEIKTLAKKYNKKVEIYFKHTGTLKFR